MHECRWCCRRGSPSGGASPGQGAGPVSNVAAEKASAELRAEQAARRQDKEAMSTMARELENAAGRCKLLEKENEAKLVELGKAL